VADFPLVLEKVPDGVNVGHGAHVIRPWSFGSEQAPACAGIV
jgi:hypothetical protein